MKTSLIVATALVAAGAASGCTHGMKRALGVEKSAPDEFRVVTKAPLVIPPDYSLRPPRPGEARPAELTTDARAAVFGQDIGGQASDGEKLLVAKAGAAAVDPKIRSEVDFEGAALVRKSDAYSDQIMNYGRAKAAPGDASAQKAALDLKEAGRRVTGGGTVTIERNDDKHFKLPGL